MESGARNPGASSPSLLAGDRVLITGGSGGIGRGLCRIAAREGARVAFTYSQHPNAAAVTEAEVRAQGGEPLVLLADLRDPAAPERLVASLHDRWGGIDVLINNAGVSEAVPFVLIEDDDLADVMTTNVVAAFRLCRAAARSMIRARHGRIVNISSIAGSRSVPGPVHYAMSKGALDGMTRSLAHELGPYGILTNSIAAGIFVGGLERTIPEHHQKRYVDACALSRLGQPDECGELACWLASRRNTYVNGTVLFQDGGTLA